MTEVLARYYGPVLTGKPIVMSFVVHFLSFLKEFSWQKYYFSKDFHWNPSNHDYFFIVIPSTNVGSPLNLSWYLPDAQKCHILCLKYANWFHAFSVFWISLSFKLLFIGVQLAWVFWSKKIESLWYSEAMILGRFWAVQKPSHSHELNCTSLICKLANFDFEFFFFSKL